MGMTPEKLAFINGQSSSAPKQKVAAPAKVDLKPADSEAMEAVQKTPSEGTPFKPRRSQRRTSSEATDPSDVLANMLVPVTIRLPHRMAQALKRAYMEQRLKHSKPDTQQEIVEEALATWLARHGYLNVA